MASSLSRPIKAVTLKSPTKKLLVLLPFILLMIAASACAVFGNSDPRADKSTEYKIDFADSLWTQISPDLADLAYLNNATGSIMTSNSQCKKYEKSTLDQLADNVVRGSGLEGIEIIEKKESKFSDRDALEMTVQGKIDGVKTFIRLLTVKKNRCVYDFTLISNTEKSFKKDQKNFEAFLKTVTIK